MKEKYYRLEPAEAELEEITNLLSSLHPEIEDNLHECESIAHYDGYSVQASFSENRAYVRFKCGTSHGEDLAVLSFLEYESKSNPGNELSYSRIGRTEFTGYKTGEP